MHTRFCLLFFLIQLISSLNLHFPNQLQRFVYNQPTDTIVLASINHIYSLNASDLTILSHIDLSLSKTNDQFCLKTNRTSLPKNLYYFSTISYLNSTNDKVFNQLLLPTSNNSILICSTNNRGSSCELRSSIDLNLLKNASQRTVSSSPFYPSIGLINENNQILYLANTYDSQCDPFYEIPTLTGRHFNNDQFLSILNLKSGQSALQQSTYTLRLLNTRLVKEFFLYYLYAFEYKHFSYFLTIQQSDIHHLHKHRLQTKIIRFCQTSNQPLIQSYMEIPLTCGDHYHYLITAKYSRENRILYGLFRNTTLANLTSTSHAVCAYSIESIQQGFYQTMKRCLVDGKGYRGLGFLSPDTHCVSSKNLNDIHEDFCPDENDSFFQYPIGGHRAIEQIQPLVEFHEKVNLTSMEIMKIEQDFLVFVGDDHGTIRTFQNFNRKELSKQKFPSKIILDLQIIHQYPTNKHAQLLILTDDQIIKQNLSVCEQYSTCDQCANQPLCHWCSEDNRCSSTFECLNENSKKNRLHMCTTIERVQPQRISSDLLNSELQIQLNKQIEAKTDEYMCRFRFPNRRDFYQTNVRFSRDKIQCFPPLLTNMTSPIENLQLSIYHIRTDVVFGSFDFKIINCSKLISCVSCTTYSNLCGWNHSKRTCISQEKPSVLLFNNSSQCPNAYLRESMNYLAYQVDKIFEIHIEQCQPSMNIKSCQLFDHRKRFLLTTNRFELIRSIDEQHFCLLKCSFHWTNSPRFIFHRSMNLHFALEFLDQTTSIIPHTHISLYSCSHLAVNCTSCLQLNPSYGCTWCNNQCMLRNQSMKCLDNHQCSLPIIEQIEPRILPLAGGSLVTIQGKYFDLFQTSIHVADVPCLIIEEESSDTKMMCQSGNAGSTSRAGFVEIKFGPYGPRIQSQQNISYTNPRIHSIEPLIGIQNGGTVLTFIGENFDIGNTHLSIFIGSRLCQLISISMTKLQCKTRTFPHSMLNKQQPIKLIFDRQTELIYRESFAVFPNPNLDSFKHFSSFVSGGHQLNIIGEHFDRIQSVQLEFNQLFFLSTISRNNTHLTFLSPSIQQLNLDKSQTIPLTIYLDNFNQSTTLNYINDPIIYQLEPFYQAYASHLIIQGENLTNLEHGKADVFVHIGCDLCTIVDLRSDRIVCQPPVNRPGKYSATKHLCYKSEHPSIIVSIDNIHSHVGFLIYPKKMIFLGMIIGCLGTLLFFVSLVLLIIYLKIRSTQQKQPQQQIYPKIKSVHYQSINSLLPIRSYVNYLQFCFSSNQLFSDQNLNLIRNQDLVNQFKLIFESDSQFIEQLVEYSIDKNVHEKFLTNLILIQRYNLKHLLKYKHDFIHFQICLLTSYELFRNQTIQNILSQLYSQLKTKITSGPIDAVEQTKSYYSLNSNSLINDCSVRFQTIQLIVSVDFNNKIQPNDFVVHLNCLTCDTISQVKQKLLRQLNFDKQISFDQCQIYLLTNSSYSSSSSTASSSVPLVRKSLLTQLISNQSTKYSTTIINDSYRDSNYLLLNDLDQTNQNTKLNTLQHYGIISDGFELKFILPEYAISQPTSCHYYSLSVFNYLPKSSNNDCHSMDDYTHLLNHTYEEIGNVNLDETYRLFETKLSIQIIVNQLIEYVFTNLLHNEIFLTELIREYHEMTHGFYAHMIPFIIRNLNYLFEISLEKYLIHSLDSLAMIFQIACCEQNENPCCSLCKKMLNNEKYQLNKQNCLIVFGDEIQRVRMFYLNLETSLKTNNFLSEYSSTNTV